MFKLLLSWLVGKPIMFGVPEAFGEYIVDSVKTSSKSNGENIVEIVLIGKMTHGRIVEELNKDHYPSSPELNDYLDSLKKDDFPTTPPTA